MLENIAAQTIDRVGWIDNDAPIQQALYNSFDISGLGVVRMEMQQHAVIYRKLMKFGRTFPSDKPFVKIC
jgi:hypothetical protein